MAHVLIMPRQGNTVESCVIVDWKVREGDQVAADTPACEVETDKATFEVPAGAAGIILKILHPAGDDVPVLEAIAVIGQKGENWAAAVGGSAAAPAATNAATPDAVPAPAQTATASQAASPASSGSAGALSAAAGTGPAAPASPRARNLATKEAVDLGPLAGSGPGGRIIERDVKAALEGRPALTAAARAAVTSGAPVPATGMGIGGRATLADLAAGTPATGKAASSQTRIGESAASLGGQIASLGSFPGPVAETAVKGIRKLIADRMLESLATTAQFTLNASASAVRLQELRARFKESSEELGLSKVTINDLLLFAVSRLLPKYPFMNAHKVGDTLKTFGRVHLGVAVDTPRGLMVPVIRNADLLTLEQISAEAKRLAAACQNGTTKPDELSGSTFTVTNLGSLGIESFTPVINTPEVAILGVCGIEAKPVLDDSSDPESSGVAFVPHIGFSLTINHQVVDGAPAARFLKAFREAVAEIDLWLAK